jgi:hypothetical protein
MKKHIKTLCTLALSASIFTATAQQGIPFPVSSPTATVSQQFATSKIEISYSRPSVKGRTIFGDVVPLGKFWRTGANAPTAITFGEDVTVNGIAVKAGKYGLVSFPNQNEWTIVLSKDLINDASDYKQENDVARFNVPVKKVPLSVESFTIDVESITNNTCNIVISWENTVVTFPIGANYDERLMKQIESVMAKDTRPYYSAANYYFENKKDLNQALVWINKAIEANPKAYWVYLLKAKIQKDLKDYNGALATSQQSYDLAKVDGDDVYMKHNEKLMAEIKQMPDFKPATPKKKK